jgi:hypothetical protein
MENPTENLTPAGQPSGLSGLAGLGAKSPTVPDNAAIARQMRYLMEADMRLSDVKRRTQCAKHWLRRRDPEHAAEELLHVGNEARRLRLHLAAWENYVISSPNVSDQPRAEDNHEQHKK